MLLKFFKNFFSNRNEKILVQLQGTLDKINDLEYKYKKYSDLKLKNKTNYFKNKLISGFKLDDILIDSFALVREASKRVFSMRHFDVQILGGIVLYKNCIAEMKTGEGKTLTSTLPIYLNSLLGKGVHVVTMNDYLAKRDANKNKNLFNFLGLTVGLNSSNISIKSKQKAYNSDITYGTNNEYGFDYLRDHMIFHKKNKVQRNLYYALIDEVDSILIDESRTPLIISGKESKSEELYHQVDSIIHNLIEQKKEDSENFIGTGDFIIDHKLKQVSLTERGLIKIENLLVENKILKSYESVYSIKNLKIMHYIISALKAHKLFFKNVDYLVKNKKVIVVDEHTGRIVKDRRWSDGLHQSIEAKEKVPIQNENKTLASITFQNYFRLYKKLSGMTGTASTESFEFYDIYRLDTVVIPTHKPMIRKDFSDLVYITEKEKIDAIIKDIKSCVLKKQPVLVGTTSIEKSEIISKELKKKNIFHNVLNAKFHKKEAEIIAKAGSLGAVTIATNMAGRGTDIVLGGVLKTKNNFHKKNNIKKSKNDFKIYKNWKILHDSVIFAGGLHVIGAERHESRRIDNQLRGRSGRQGDIGSSRFYISMEDVLMRTFIPENTAFFLRKLGMKYGDSIEHSWVNNAISNAQKKIEIRNFEIRKQLLEYDDVINEQRKVIYKQRSNLINSNNISNMIKKISKDVFLNFLNSFFKKYKKFSKEKILKILSNRLKKIFNIKCNLEIFCIKKNVFLEKKKILNLILEVFKKNIKSKNKFLDNKIRRKLEIKIMLSTLDFFWQDHLSSMDHLRQSIVLRGYIQKDPIQEYKKESFFIFSKMLDMIKNNFIQKISFLKDYNKI